MKKLMIATAAVAAAFGLKAEIASANIVGFNTDTITATKFNMVSVPFEGTDGQGFKLNECISGENLVGTASSSTADRIQIWDAATGAYENWYFYDNNDEYTGWWDEGTGLILFEDSYPNGLPAGSAFWYKSAAGASANGSVTVSGQVPEAEAVDVEILKGKFNMVAYPWPMGFKLNDAKAVSWANATGSASSADADKIQIWDAATGAYENWYYYFNNDEYTGWWDEGTGLILFEDTYPNGLAAGKPFWYKAVGTGTFEINFTK